MNNRDEISKAISHQHLILLPSGREIPLALENASHSIEKLDEVGNKELKAYVLAEELKGQERPQPPSIKAMQAMEWAGYEPASDNGHFTHFPKGQLVFELLRDWAYEIAVNRFGAMPIESPILYRWDDPEIQAQAASFHEHHYSVRVPGEGKDDFILRFAGDFGLFKAMQRMNFSEKMLPLRIYEFSKSFRYEKRGALSGFKRLRAFHMPDIHSFCRDIEQGWEEYAALFCQYAELADAIGVEYAVVFRIVNDFYSLYKDKIISLLEKINKPAFIDVLSDMKHYWAVKHEFQAIDSVGGNVQLSTVQLDVKDASVYGINFVSDSGAKKGCIICHSSIGSLERWIYSILEQALKQPKPNLPLWLAPCQCRILPVSDEMVPFCEALSFEKVRWEIDDANDTIGKKVMRAGKDWIPYLVVVGRREMEKGVLSVTRRSDGMRYEVTREVLNREINELCANRPFRGLTLPRKLSRQPVFYG